MRGRSSDPSKGTHASVDFLTESDHKLLRQAGSALTWPQKPLGFSIHARWIPTQPSHGQQYINLSYQVRPSVRLGVDYRPGTGDVSLLANWRVFPENDGWRPALILGTSNTDFGEINSDNYYATFSKYLFNVGGINLSAYAGATFIEEFNDLRPVGGIHLRKDAWSSTFSYNGINEHFSISRDLGNHTVTFILFDLERPGLAYGFRF